MIERFLFSKMELVHCISYKMQPDLVHKKFTVWTVADNINWKGHQ